MGRFFFAVEECTTFLCPNTWRKNKFRLGQRHTFLSNIETFGCADPSLNEIIFSKNRTFFIMIVHFFIIRDIFTLVDNV